METNPRATTMTTHPPTRPNERTTPNDEHNDFNQAMHKAKPWIIGIIVVGAAAIAGIGFAGSFDAVSDLAREKGFGDFSPFLPLGVDAGIIVLLAMDLLMTWLRMPFPLLRQTAWLLTAATIAFNGAASWPDLLGVGMHAVIPVLFIIAVEAARHAIGRIANITADRHFEYPPLFRWFVATVSTAYIVRRQRKWAIRSYVLVLSQIEEKRIFIAALREEYGKGWKKLRKPEEYDKAYANLTAAGDDVPPSAEQVREEQQRLRKEHSRKLLVRELATKTGKSISQVQELLLEEEKMRREEALKAELERRNLEEDEKRRLREDEDERNQRALEDEKRRAEAVRQSKLEDAKAEQELAEINAQKAEADARARAAAEKAEAQSQAAAAEAQKQKADADAHAQAIAAEEQRKQQKYQLQMELARKEKEAELAATAAAEEEKRRLRLAAEEEARKERERQRELEHRKALAALKEGERQREEERKQQERDRKAEQRRTRRQEAAERPQAASQAPQQRVNGRLSQEASDGPVGREAKRLHRAECLQKAMEVISEANRTGRPYKAEDYAGEFKMSVRWAQDVFAEAKAAVAELAGLGMSG